MSTDILVQNLYCTSFLISTLVPLALNLPKKSHFKYGVVKGAKQSLPMQLGFKLCQCTSLN